jgi:hypothetical protein
MDKSPPSPKCFFITRLDSKQPSPETLPELPVVNSPPELIEPSTLTLDPTTREACIETSPHIPMESKNLEAPQTLIFDPTAVNPREEITSENTALSETDNGPEIQLLPSTEMP